MADTKQARLEFAVRRLAMVDAPGGVLGTDLVLAIIVNPEQAEGILYAIGVIWPELLAQANQALSNGRLA